MLNHRGAELRRVGPSFDAARQVISSLRRGHYFLQSFLCPRLYMVMFCVKSDMKNEKENNLSCRLIYMVIR